MEVLSFISNTVSWMKRIISKERITLRILSAAFGLFLTISGCVLFGVLGNIHAAIWSGFSAVLVTLVLSLHVCTTRDVQRKVLKSHHFDVLVVLGIIGFAAGLLGLIVYIILGKQHREKGFHTHSNYMVCAWNVSTLVGGFALLYYGKKYRSEYCEADEESAETTETIFKNEAAEMLDNL